MTRARRVRRTFIAMSALDYFADMTLVVTSVLLLQARGLGTAAIFATVAAVWLIEGVFEIPTGLVADIFGRRQAILASLALRAIGYSALFFSDRVEIAVAGTLLAAVGSTFLSGALEAWAVDELTALGEKSFDWLFTRARVAENVGLVLGTMTGAGLGMVSLALPQMAAGGASVAGIVIVGMFVEETPRFDPKERFSTSVWSAARTIGIGTARLFRGDKVLLGLIGGSALLWTLRGVPGVQWSAHFESLANKNLLVLGIMRCSSALAEIPLLLFLARFQERRRSLRPQILFSAAATGGTLLFAAALADSSLLAILAYVGFCVSMGLCMPGIRAAMNERIGASHRATALSCVAFLCNTLTGVGLLLVGAWVTDLRSVSTSWPLAGAGFVVVGVLLALLAGQRAETRVDVLSAAE